MFIVAGTKSGVGKTTVTLAVMAALKKRGLIVSPFKAGPDYIDPGLHERLLNKPSYNLDTWMMGTSGVKKTFREQAAGSDVAVIEGVMGLFDGKGTTEAGSTAELAKTLSLPVLLVVDASGTARSIAAVVKGFKEFDKKVKLLGVIFNNVGSARHEELLRGAVKGLRVPVLGAIPRDASLVLPSRHLGLVTGRDIDSKKWRAFVSKARRMAERYIDIDALLKASRKTPKAGKKKERKGAEVKIAVARDSAFLFYYKENLDILRSLGAKLLFFSPVKDKKLPKGAQGLYLGGGYPELFARKLSVNKAMRVEIKEFSKSGRPVLAECGGLIYLGNSVKPKEGKAIKMAGVFPFKVKLGKRVSALGYREAVVKSGMPFLKQGEKLRGHEFRYSTIAGTVGNKNIFTGASGVEGYVKDNTLATYMHLHFASNTGFAEGFIRVCKDSE